MLRITKQTDYGIVLMTYFASREAGSVHNARDLAEETALPLPTVSKILKALQRAALLTSHRGVKGGYSLARAPQAISVEEVIAALEGPIAITECLGETDDECGIERVCPVRANWHRINEAVRSALQNIPLTEMTAAQMFPPAATQESEL
jgi:FeS assembly SUF system regulator